VIAVEGYVDVIAMVTAGFPATVAPLGTALTEDQLALLWKLADEPILCFDGDNAGRKAAYRAVDLALPRLKPGKSVRFALLPEGQDPDDLVRSAGREAVAEVLASARPLAEMLWNRETETSSFDTPERRAALEARIGAVAASIGDESVRRYYKQDLEARLRNLFEPQLARLPSGRRDWQGGARSPGRYERSRRGAPGRPFEGMRPNTPRLGTSPIVRGFRSAMPPREALILVAVVNHPWLLDTHTEDFAELEFLNPDANQLRRAILDAAAAERAEETSELRAAILAAGLGSVLARVEAAITHASDWPARDGASPDDVSQWWSQVVTLHRKTRTLNKELKDAERALGEEPTEANLAWLLDVQSRLSTIDGTEAIIDGFGASSGRSARSV
jgi:DNA primase